MSKVNQGIPETHHACTGVIWEAVRESTRQPEWTQSWPRRCKKNTFHNETDPKVGACFWFFVFLKDGPFDLQSQNKTTNM